MKHHFVDDATMVAIFGAVCGLLLAGAIILTSYLDRCRHAKVRRAREASAPASEWASGYHDAP